jgi:predicted site-specific integrase-resolvase
MKGHGSKFDRKQEEAIAALLTQRNIEEAARVAGVAGTTLVRWLQIPEFQAAYREARRAAFSQSIARLQQASSAAVSVLIKIMVDPDAPTSSRVRAADVVLERASKAIELEDLDQRIAELEAASKQRAAGR